MNHTPALPEALDRLQRLGFLAGIAGTLLAGIGLLVSGAPDFFQVYLFAYLYILGLALGGLALAMLQALVSSQWGTAIQRITQASAQTLWLCGLLFIPLLFGLPDLYPWARPDEVASDPVLQHQSIYLNPAFFVFRAALYFAIWIFLARGVVNWSRRPQDFGDRRRRQRLSASGLIAYVLSMTFASVDWIMSIEPHWISTIYGMLTIIAQALSGITFSIVLLALLARADPLKSFLTPGRYRDLGAIFLTLVSAWAYLVFSQLLIIWSGNLPREISWYLTRTTGAWLWLGVLVFILQFVLPFSILISLRAKQNPRLLVALSLVLVGSRLLDQYWEILPAFRPEGLAFHWLDPILPAALAGFWLAVFIWRLRLTPQPELSLQPQEAVSGSGRQPSGLNR